MASSGQKAARRHTRGYPSDTARRMVPLHSVSEAERRRRSVRRRMSVSRIISAHEGRLLGSCALHLKV